MGSKNEKRLHDVRNYGGRGKMKCGVCGEPIVTHDTMKFCENGKDGEKMNPSFLIDEVGRRRMRKDRT